MLGLILSAALGAIFGSYATLFAYRLPLGESCFGRYFGQKSRCPQCSSIIRTRELIPVINWLITFGRCRNCKTKIPRTHLFIELTTTALFVLCYLKFSLSEEFMIYALVFVGLVILLVTDFTHKTFPNPVLNFILVVGIAGRILADGNVSDTVFSASIGIVLATIFYQIFFKKAHYLFSSESQCFDYIKLILVVSACLTLKTFLLYFISLITIMAVLIACHLPKRVRENKNKDGFGYVLILPFIYLLLCSPLSS